MNRKFLFQRGKSTHLSIAGENIFKIRFVCMCILCVCVCFRLFRNELHSWSWCNELHGLKPQLI
jgi:hypothetical protein